VLFLAYKLITLNNKLPELLHNFQKMLFIQKYVYHRSKLPAVFSTYFEEIKLLHSHDTRQKNDFHTYAVQSEIGKRTIRYRGSKLWNNLPDDLKNTTVYIITVF